MHKFGSWTASGATAGAWTAADGSLGEVITRRVRGSVIVAINTTAGTSTSGSNYTLKCYKQVPGETPETVFITPAVATFNGVARYTQVIVGKQAITLVGTPGATTTDLTVAVSSQFTIGDYVLLVNSDNSIQEVTLVTAKPSGKITVNNTVNTIADTWFAIPMFRNAEIVSCASSAASQVIELFAYPDRAITL